MENNLPYDSERARVLREAVMYATSRDGEDPKESILKEVIGRPYFVERIGYNADDFDDYYYNCKYDFFGMLFTVRDILLELERQEILVEHVQTKFKMDVMSIIPIVIFAFEGKSYYISPQLIVDREYYKELRQEDVDLFIDLDEDMIETLSKKEFKHRLNNLKRLELLRQEQEEQESKKEKSHLLFKR